MNKLLKQARKEYSPTQRFAALLALAPLFLLLLPLLVISGGARLDEWLGWPSVFSPLVNLPLAALLIVAGLVFAMWSIYAQFTIGRGTPVPVMATQKLIIQPPFSYCRNPMALGSILMYLGVAVLVGSAGGALLVLILAALLLAYIQRFEEKEMELRFGQEYLEYKQRTPFLLPHFGKRP